MKNIVEQNSYANTNNSAYRKIIINLPEHFFKNYATTQDTNINVTAKSNFVSAKEKKSKHSKKGVIVDKEHLAFLDNENVIELPKAERKGISNNIDHKKIKKFKKRFAKANVNSNVLINIMNNFSGSIYIKDKSGKYLVCNNQHAKSLGLQKNSEVINKKDSDFIKNDQIIKNINHNDFQVLKTRESIIVQEPSPKEKNSVILWNKFPYRDPNGTIIGVIGISLNISKDEKHKIELSAEALEKRRRILDNIGHEIRIPLQGVACILQEIISQWDFLSEVQTFDLITKAAANSNRLMTTALHLLDLSKIDFDNFNLDKKKSNLNFIVINAIAEVSQSCNSSKIFLEIGEKCDPEINIDPLRISQVVKSLLNNALQNSSENITVRIESYTKEQELQKDITSAIKFSITYKDSLQNKTSDLEDTTQQSNASGLRLGLSICREIIDLHDGEIWTEKTKTGKHTSCFVIPRTSEQKKECKTKKSSEPKVMPSRPTMPIQIKASSQPKPTAEKQSVENLNILFVDDEDACVTSATLILSSLNHKMTVASNGIEALEKLKEGYDKFDLIFLDIMMPGMNGIETLKAIKNNPKYKHIPVFMQSGISDGLTLKEAINLGANKEFMQKPFTRKDIVSFLSLISKYFNKNESPENKTSEDKATVSKESEEKISETKAHTHEENNEDVSDDDDEVEKFVPEKLVFNNEF